MTIRQKIAAKAFDWLFANVASRRGADVVIGGDRDPYMSRWFVIPRNRMFNVYLHLFLRSDDDRALHDHPWWNCSFLLAGHYIEETVAAGGVHHRREYKTGDLKFRSARYAHRIELIDGAPCWSLFMTGPNLRSWGFHCPQGWRHWREFTDPTGKTVGKGCDE